MKIRSKALRFGEIKRVIAINQEKSIDVCIFLKKRKIGAFCFIKMVKFATFL
jgi:hypothetical protein